SGNVFIADTYNNALKELLTRTFVPGPVSVGAAAGSSSLLPVLPTTQPLTGVYAPSSDQPWLTISSVAGGVVNFSFTANPGFGRTGHISLLGRQVAVTQYGPQVLASSALLEGPGAGSDAVLVSAASWTATANAAWLHTTASGTGNGLASFTFDANTGATRSGT